MPEAAISMMRCGIGFAAAYVDSASKTTCWLKSSRSLPILLTRGRNKPVH